LDAMSIARKCPWGTSKESTRIDFLLSSYSTIKILQRHE